MNCTGGATLRTTILCSKAAKNFRFAMIFENRRLTGSKMELLIKNSFIIRQFFDRKRRMVIIGSVVHLQQRHTIGSVVQKDTPPIKHKRNTGTTARLYFSILLYTSVICTLSLLQHMEQDIKLVHVISNLYAYVCRSVPVVFGHLGCTVVQNFRFFRFCLILFHGFKDFTFKQIRNLLHSIIWLYLFALILINFT